MSAAGSPITTDALVGADLRLVVADMDGTLLDPSGRITEATWAALGELAGRGVTFSPASGRQYATLRAVFSGGPVDPAELVFICENGTVVVRGGEVLDSTPLPDGLVPEVVSAVRRLAADGGDLGLVVCCPEVAYVERADAAFVDECGRYYHRLEVVPDLVELVTSGALEASPVKLAVYDFRAVETATAPALQDFTDRAQVVVSGRHWIDLMALGVDKGVAVRALQERLGVTSEQTAVFGDYLNDVQMLGAARYSFAMDNAHPEVLELARHRAPSNAEDGVARVLRSWLDA